MKEEKEGAGDKIARHLNSFFTEVAKIPKHLQAEWLKRAKAISEDMLNGKGMIDFRVTKPFRDMYEHLDKLEEDMKVRPPEKQRPPKGIPPKFIWQEERLEEIKKAILRRRNTDADIPIEWYEEFFELTDELYEPEVTFCREKDV